MKFNTHRFWQLAVLILTIGLLANPFQKGINNMISMINPSFSMPVAHAGELYPKFTCPCCNQPLNKEEPCCEAMVEMINFIDKQIDSGVDPDEALILVAKEYGLARVTSDADREVIRTQLLADAPDNAPRINISESRQDLGTIGVNDGITSADFILTNQGQSDLVISKLASSCGCTSASLIYQDVEGPRFYMAGHGFEEPSDDWQVNIAPSDEAIIRVYYDPTIHPDLEGAVTRNISIFSNDPVDFETMVYITLEQTIN